jgi:integrase
MRKLHDEEGSFRDAARRRREVIQGESLAKPEGYASSLRSYGKFCVDYGEPPFPVEEEAFLDFIALANTSGSVNTHVAALRKACRLLEAPFNVSDKGIQDVKNGLKRLRKGKKRQTCSFSLPLVWKILETVSDDFKPIFAWCFAFALRVGEAPALQRGNERAAKRNELPDGRESAVALYRSKVSVVLASRKNALAGDTVRRPCFCKIGERWKGLCPVHVLMPEQARRADGEKFFGKTYGEALQELKDACVRIGVDLPAPVGTHSMRRSAIQLMEKKGAEKFAPGLGLMGLGSHKSSAVNDYRDKKAVGEKGFMTAVLCEISDGDSDEDSVY